MWCDTRDDRKLARFYTRSAAAGMGSFAKGMIDIFIRQLLFTAKRAVFDEQIKCVSVRCGRHYFNKCSCEVHVNPNSVFCVHLQNMVHSVLRETVYTHTQIYNVYLWIVNDDNRHFIFLNYCYAGCVRTRVKISLPCRRITVNTFLTLYPADYLRIFLSLFLRWFSVCNIYCSSVSWNKTAAILY